MLKFLSRQSRNVILSALIVCLMVAPVVASTGGAVHVTDASLILFWLAILLLLARMTGFIERFGLPAVFGEIITGAILGNLFMVGITFFEPIKTDVVMNFLAQLGVVILLFQIGLESNLSSMRKVGARALAVAIVGVVATFALGYLVIPLLLPELSSMARLFLAGAFTSTSVGISARVFRDLGKLQSSEAQLVLGAAILDDVIGLIILAVLSAMVTKGNADPAIAMLILAKAVIFLAASVLLGQLIARTMSKFFSKLHAGTGMKLTVALSFGFIFAFLAQKIELAPIIGAFAAGLVLDPVHFRLFKDPKIVEELREETKGLPANVKDKISALVSRHADKHIEEIIEPLGLVFVPLFFILTGMNVQLSVLGNPAVLFGALGLAAMAIVGKLLAGLAAGGVRKSVVGWGMVPRGEVQLIFAAMGKSLGILPAEVFSMVVIVVIVTTLIVPVVLSYLLKDKTA